MGEIRKVNHYTGEDMGAVGNINSEDIAGRPFICVYDAVSPKVPSGQHLVEKSLSGGLKAYVRFETSKKFDSMIGHAGSFVATQENIGTLGYDDTDTLWKSALTTMIEYGVFAKSFARFMSDMSGIPAEAFGALGNILIATLKANDGQLGAGILAVPCMLEQVRENIGDFYILPCSRHEIICVPYDEAELDIEDFRNMVQQVNMEALEEEDKLSDNVFCYDENGLHEA